MKWTKKKIEGSWNYSLKINNNFIFQIEPDEDGYIIWFAALGWFRQFLKVKKFKTAKIICNGIAIILERNYEWNS
uniref:Uncharacterized protein n=1 Tax=viral metagenome TaxID=1070528 RepID=A0A6H1ZRG3_9ZZZZ